MPNCLVCGKMNEWRICNECRDKKTVAYVDHRPDERRLADHEHRITVLESALLRQMAEVERLQTICSHVGLDNRDLG